MIMITVTYNTACIIEYISHEDKSRLIALILYSFQILPPVLAGVRVEEQPSKFWHTDAWPSNGRWWEGNLCHLRCLNVFRTVLIPVWTIRLMS